MKYVLYIMLCLCLPACGDDVVDNHAPSNNIRVDGNAVTYMCTKVSE